MTSFWPRLRTRLFGYDVFISYKRSDGIGYAMALEHMLVGQGLTVFRDAREIPSGGVLWDVIETALKRSRMVVFVGTPKALRKTSPLKAPENEKRDWVRKELSTALEQGKQIVSIYDSRSSVLFPKLLERKWIHEHPWALRGSRPTLNTNAEIIGAVKFRTVHFRARALLAAVLIVFALLLVGLGATIRGLNKSKVERASVEARELAMSTSLKATQLANHSSVAFEADSDSLPEAIENALQAVETNSTTETRAVLRALASSMLVADASVHLPCSLGEFAWSPSRRHVAVKGSGLEWDEMLVVTSLEEMEILGGVEVPVSKRREINDIDAFALTSDPLALFVARSEAISGVGFLERVTRGAQGEWDVEVTSPGRFWSLVASPDEEQLAAVLDDYLLRVYRARDLGTVGTIELKPLVKDDLVRELSFCPSAPLIAVLFTESVIVFQTNLEGGLKPIFTDRFDKDASGDAVTWNDTSMVVSRETDVAFVDFSLDPDADTWKGAISRKCVITKVDGVVPSSDGETLAVSSTDFGLKQITSKFAGVTDWNPGARACELFQGKFKWHSNDRLLVTGTQDRSGILGGATAWDASHGAAVFHLVHDSRVVAVDSLIGGSKLFSIGDDSRIIRWTGNGTILQRGVLELDPTFLVTMHLAVDPVFGTIAKSERGISDKQTRLEVWRDGGLLATGVTPQKVKALHIHRDGRQIIWVSEQGISCATDLESLDPQEPKPFEGLGTRGRSGSIEAACIGGPSPLVVIVTESGDLSLHGMDGACINRQTIESSFATAGRASVHPSGIVMDKQGTRVAVGLTGGVVTYTLPDFVMIDAVRTPYRVSELEFSPNHDQLIVSSSTSAEKRYKTGEAEIWVRDVAKQETAKLPRQGGSRYGSVSVDPSGTRIAFTANGEVEVWKLPNASEEDFLLLERIPSSAALRWCAFGPDHTLFVHDESRLWVEDLRAESLVEAARKRIQAYRRIYRSRL